GWGWSVVGAVAIVLAAMYMVRLISAVLHRQVGPAVSDAALDLRPAELGVVVPLIACLLALSAWPAAITQHSFRGDHAQAVLATAISYRERSRDEHAGEYYALLGAVGAGMVFFVAANNLMTLFLGLEWFSIGLYILCAIDRDRLGGLEAALKYLVVGGFGSAVLLFGSALVYGASGALGFADIAASGRQHDTLLVFGLGMIIAGLAFKASAAPFH